MVDGQGRTRAVKEDNRRRWCDLGGGEKGDVMSLDGWLDGPMWMLVCTEINAGMAM